MYKNIRLACKLTYQQIVLSVKWLISKLVVSELVCPINVCEAFQPYWPLTTGENLLSLLKTRDDCSWQCDKSSTLLELQKSYIHIPHMPL